MHKRSNHGTTRLVITGGGTGGHVFPGIAVAEALAAITPIEVLWLGTDRKVEVNALAATDWKHDSLDVTPIKGTGIANKLKAVFNLPAAVIRAAFRLKNFGPHVVLGVGGYVSGPVLLAARILGIPSAIHEQNAVPGLANRMAARFADRIFVTYRESEAFFKNPRIELTGNPVRSAILNSAITPSENKQDMPSVLVLGGSQGAAALNRVVSAALRNIWQSGHKVHIVHQTGEASAEETEAYYRKEGIEADVRPFITDMAQAYRQADLVISRAGATTLAEITALGKPSILIPYPYAADNHQEKNAQAMTDAGAAIMFLESDIGAMRLAGEIENILGDRARLETMSKAAMKLGKRDAAAHIAKELMSLAGRTALSGQQYKETGSEEIHSHFVAPGS